MSDAFKHADGAGRIGGADWRIDGLTHVLTTTRSVRMRLDYDRPVPLEVVGECLQLALQAPTGGAAEDWRWLVVGDRTLKDELARLYLSAYREYVEKPLNSTAGTDDPMVKGRLGGAGSERTARILRGAAHLANTIGRAPYLVIPCATRPNPATGGAGTNSAVYGSLYPAIWQFNLALRARGLGTCLTTLHLHHAGEVTRLLGIPAEAVQITMLPVAYTKGTDFRPAARKAVREVAFLDGWGKPLPYEERPFPRRESPHAEAPSKTEASHGETPHGETPHGETPLKAETPLGEAPPAEAPLKAEAPHGETPNGETPNGETPNGETPSEAAVPHGETDVREEQAS